VQRIDWYFRKNLEDVRQLTFGVPPLEVDKNLIFLVGDSTTQGMDGGGSKNLYPYGPCLVTANCYDAGFDTVLPDVNRMGWDAVVYGMPGAGIPTFAREVALREAKAKGEGNGLRVAVHWGGINGISAEEAAPCAWVEDAKAAGIDAWVMTLYSLSSTVAKDQAARDVFNAREIQVAKQCGAIGVINLADDALIGRDGTNSIGTYFHTNNAAHATASGYARVASIVKRVLTDYYAANPLSYTVVTSSNYMMKGYDRYMTFDSSVNPVEVTLPDCIGLGGSGVAYSFKTKGSRAISLKPVAVPGQVETIEGGPGPVALTAGQMYRYVVATNATATSASGGCDWQQVP
jgi:hypothetical protein